jgi:hypothetical protein
MVGTSELLIFLATPVAIILPGVLIQHAFRKGQDIHWFSAVAGLIVQLILGGYLAYLTSAGRGLYAFFMSVFAGVVTVIASIWMLISLPGKRRLAALVFIVQTALILFASLTIGSFFSPEGTDKRSTAAIAQAVDEYHINTGSYPVELEEFVPGYLPAIPVVVSIPDRVWFYQSTSDTYTLGYWIEPHGGVIICLRGSEWEGEDCRDTVEDSSGDDQ